MNNTKCAAYIRVSSQEQASDEHYSIPEQTDRIRKFCESKDWHLVKTYIDPGFSGANTERPALQELMRDCKAYDVVVVWKLDRLSRKQKDMMELIELFQKHNVALVSMQESFDTSTSFGIAMVGILSVFAQLERDQITERMSMGRHGRAKKGLWRGGNNAPKGYDLIDGKLIINEERASQVREAGNLILAGWSGHRITKYMHDKYGWVDSFPAIHTVLQPVNMGLIKYNDELYQGQHEPIFTPEVYKKMDDTVKMNAKKKGDHWQNPFRATYLLTGIIRCGICGERYSVYTSHIKNGKTYSYYACRGKPKCGNKWKRTQVIDQVVIDEVLKLNFEDIKPVAAKDNSKELASIEKRISKLIDLYEVDGIDISDLRSRISSLQEKKDKLLENPITPDITLSEAKSIAQRASDIFSSDNMHEKRMLLQSLLKEITVFPDRLIFVWKFL